MIMLDLNGKSILITGGTGSLGKHLTKNIIEKFPKVKRLVIFSRDEQKQFEMAQEYPHTKYPAIRFFIGDVRDCDRLKKAFKDIDYVIHVVPQDISNRLQMYSLYYLHPLNLIFFLHSIRRYSI